MYIKHFSVACAQPVFNHVDLWNFFLPLNRFRSIQLSSFSDIQATRKLPASCFQSIQSSWDSLRWHRLYSWHSSLSIKPQGFNTLTPRSTVVSLLPAFLNRSGGDPYSGMPVSHLDNDYKSATAPIKISNISPYQEEHN